MAAASGYLIVYSNIIYKTKIGLRHKKITFTPAKLVPKY